MAQPVEFPPDISNEVIFPNSDLDSNQPPLESELYVRQINILCESLELWWKERNDFYAAGNLTIYYTDPQKKSDEFRGSDFFVVLGTERKYRKSWVVWGEDGKYPHFILELLSESTIKTDKQLKKQIYQNTFRAPNYFWFDPNTLEFAGFNLLGGKYQPLEANERGYLWSEMLRLYLGIHERELRFFTPEGQLLPRLEKTAELARLNAELARVNAELARANAELERQQKELVPSKSIPFMLSLGATVEQVAEVLDLEVELVQSMANNTHQSQSS